MKKIKIFLMLILFFFVITGCFNNEEKVEEDKNNNQIEEKEEIEEEESADRYETGLPKRVPFYPNMTFLEEEEKISDFQRVFIYESADDVETIYEWYMDQFEKSTVYFDITPGHVSDDYSVVNVRLIQEFNGVEIEVSDIFQIDRRSTLDLEVSRIRIATAEME